MENASLSPCEVRVARSKRAWSFLFGEPGVVEGFHKQPVNQLLHRLSAAAVRHSTVFMLHTPGCDTDTTRARPFGGDHQRAKRRFAVTGIAK